MDSGTKTGGNAPLKDFRLSTIHLAASRSGESALVNLCAVNDPLK
jgi:hypothetical protein